MGASTEKKTANVLGETVKVEYHRFVSGKQASEG